MGICADELSEMVIRNPETIGILSRLFEDGKQDVNTFIDRKDMKEESIADLKKINLICESDGKIKLTGEGLKFISEVEKQYTLQNIAERERLKLENDKLQFRIQQMKNTRTIYKVLLYTFFFGWLFDAIVLSIIAEWYVGIIPGIMAGIALIAIWKFNKMEVL